MKIRKRRWIGFLTAGAAALASAPVAALAQEALPKVAPPFAGKVDADRNQSTPDWPQQVKARAGAPNIVLVLLDDVGFAATSVTGGPVKAPELEKLASEGLRYNSFHVNALCSPTRAALLSGRNNHQLGFGAVADGAIVAEGRHEGGFALFVKDGKPVHEVTAAGHEVVKIVGSEPLPAGQGAWGNFANNFRETLDVGEDLGTPVSSAYRSPYAFTGTIGAVAFDLK